MESKRQLQLARTIQLNLSEIFRKEGFNMYGRAMVTISQVRMTPDLQLARAYFSIYNVEDKQGILDNLRDNISPIRRMLGKRIRNKVRIIPDLEFYLDDSLDEVFKLEKLFENLNTDQKDEEE